MTNKDQYPDILYKYIDITGGLSMLQNEELWFRRIGFLNDPYDCYLTHACQEEYPLWGVEFNANRVFEYTGICSLSETANNYLMWSYYNLHKGICVGINMAFVYSALINHYIKEVNAYLTFRKVAYKDELPDLKLHNIVPLNFQEIPINDKSSDTAQEEINGFLSTKAKWWEHENEYRLILRQRPNPALFLNDLVKLRLSNLINRVYLGCKFDGDPDAIITLAKEKKFDVYKFKLQSNTYVLDAEKIYSPIP